MSHKTGLPHLTQYSTIWKDRPYGFDILLWKLWQIYGKVIAKLKRLYS